LVNLTRIKTKNELIGEVIGLLMSPIQRVIGALQNRPETTETPEGKAEVAPEAKVETAEAPKAEAPKEETPKNEAAAKPASDDAEKAPEA
jgi:large subunit ribosomal protein L10